MTNEEIIKGLQAVNEHIGKHFNEGGAWMAEFICEAINLLEQTRWIPCSERLPKENEYIKDVCKYYLIQDEYGDMHVAHLSNVGWIPMNSLKAIGDEVIAWMPLPQPYKAESKIEQASAYADQDTMMPAT